MTMIALLLIQLAAPRDTALIAAARKAAERATIEAMANYPGLVAVRSVQLLDVDGDGRPEAFVWIQPHMRQSPYILIYTTDSAGVLHLLLEALAPGRLQPVSGQLVDDHTLGFGVDLVVGKPGQPVDVDRLLSAAQGTGMTLVQYRTFFHADNRQGYRGYIDVTDRVLPDSTTKTCEAFEFSPVEGIAAGVLAGSSNGRFLVALTKSDLTMYQFQGIRANGTLIKKTWIRDRPPGVTGLTISAAGQISLVTKDGGTAPVAAP